MRLEEKKPSIIFLGGDSGEGKSMAALRILEKGQEDIDLVNQVIYTPYEYPSKVKNMLFNKEFKKRMLGQFTTFVN
jgi:ribose 1,5-bisphosphokinase PhnN